MNKATDYYNFFTQLHISAALPKNVEVLNPYVNQEVLDVNRLFYNKFYSDTHTRVLVLGINPGRFGAGITGIAFTDPIELEQNLGIKNTFEKKAELSAGFIHKAINAFGGPEEFYAKFLVSAISPLGFIKNGININYYDQKDLQESTQAFIEQSISNQHLLTGKIRACICVGQGKNLKYLHELNSKLDLFDEIIPLGHPRWIMQYRRKEYQQHVNSYIDTLNYIVKKYLD
jgi:hypothetical protein